SDVGVDLSHIFQLISASENVNYALNYVRLVEGLLGAEKREIFSNELVEVLYKNKKVKFISEIIKFL
ncbi:MAG: hypothetical protein ACXWQQ_15890, partial [Pseudobdellovibrio sp.]